MVIVQVEYHVKEGKLQELIAAVREHRIAEITGGEEGNLRYEYAVPLTRENILLLNEMWDTAEHIEQHLKQEHMLKMMKIKEKYVDSTVCRKYEASIC